MFACIRRDHRWWWRIDERPVCLARLVRDLRLPVGKVLGLLREDHGEDHGEDEDNAFDNTLEVLTALGGGGDPASVDGLRDDPMETPEVRAAATARLPA